MNSIQAFNQQDGKRRRVVGSSRFDVNNQSDDESECEFLTETSIQIPTDDLKQCKQTVVDYIEWLSKRIATLQQAQIAFLLKEKQNVEIFSHGKKTSKTLADQNLDLIEQLKQVKEKNSLLMHTIQTKELKYRVSDKTFENQVSHFYNAVRNCKTSSLDMKNISLSKGTQSCIDTPNTSYTTPLKRKPVADKRGLEYYSFSQMISPWSTPKTPRQKLTPNAAAITTTIPTPLHCNVSSITEPNEEVEMYKAKVACLEKDNKELLERIDTVGNMPLDRARVAENLCLKEQIQLLMKERLDLNFKLQRLETIEGRIQFAENQVQSLTRLTGETYSPQTKTASQQCSKSSQQLKKLQNDNLTLKRQAQMKEQIINKLTAEVQAHKTSLSKSQSNLVISLKDGKTKYDNLLAAHRVLAKKKSELENDLTIQETAKSGNVQVQQIEIKDLNAKVMDLETKLKQRENVLSLNKQNIQRLKLQLQKEQGQGNEATALVKKLQSEIKSANEEKEKGVKEFQAFKLEHNTQIKNLNNKISQLGSSENGKAQALQANRKSLQLNQQLKTSKVEVNKLKNQIETLNDQLKTANQQKSDPSSSVTVETLKKKLAAAEEKYTKQGKRLQDNQQYYVAIMSEQKKKFKEDNSTLTSGKVAAEKQISVMKMKNSLLSTKVKENTEEIKAKDVQIAEMETRIETINNLATKYRTLLEQMQKDKP